VLQAVRALPGEDKSETRGARPAGAEEGNARARGMVYLVGAGPGDPELLTVKALRCLRHAEVVVYDRLVGTAVLAEVPPSAELLFVGKAPGAHSATQEDINALLVRKALLGQVVVRLKGGDPFVFGRGGEEALALAQAGIAYEIIPGISASIAVPAYAGIPVTHRGAAPLFTVVTGQEERSSGAPAVDWHRLAVLGGTLVILMGTAALPDITAQLIAGGLDTRTPAAVIQNGTLPAQRCVSGTLGTIAERVAQAGLRAPAVTVIGAVAALHEQLSWRPAVAGLPMEHAASGVGTVPVAAAP
jgi:uroporphyrin-III C-methyltransferase